MLKVTVTPSKDVESGIVDADFIPAAKFVPKIETKEPGEIACPPAKLAPFTTPPLEMTGVWAIITPAINVWKIIAK